jgi:hypothetical protein
MREGEAAFSPARIPAGTIQYQEPEGAAGMRYGLDNFIMPGRI